MDLPACLKDVTICYWELWKVSKLLTMYIRLASMFERYHHTLLRTMGIQRFWNLKKKKSFPVCFCWDKSVFLCWSYRYPIVIISMGSSSSQSLYSNCRWLDWVSIFPSSDILPCLPFKELFPSSVYSFTYFERINLKIATEYIHRYFGFRRTATPWWSPKWIWATLERGNCIELIKAHQRLPT